MTKFQDVPQFTRSAGHQSTQSWRYLLEKIDDWVTDLELELDPDFQRAHVWVEQQQIRYVEYVLRGGISGKDIYLNHPGWMGTFKGAFVLVDGKQRLNAVMRFLRNEIPAFGSVYSEYTDRLPLHASFTFHINDLKTRAEVLQWYIDLNAGGVAHTEEEIEKVRALLTQEAATL